MKVFNLHIFDEDKFVYYYSEFVPIGKIREYNVFFSSLGGKMILCTEKEQIYRKLAEEKNKEPDISRFLEKKIVVSIYLTTNCNCECAYCYAKATKTEGGKQSFEKIKNFLDMVVGSGVEVVHLRFQGGGEPTLEIPLIKKTVEYARRKHRIERFEIQSNLLFDQKTAQYLGKNFFQVICSVDGMPEIQARQRGVSPEEGRKIERNLKYLLTKNLKIPIKCTVSRYSNNKLREIIDYFSSLGVKEVVMEPVFAMGRASSPESDYNSPPEFEDFLREFTEAKKYGEKQGVFAISCFLPVEFSGLHYCGGVSGTLGLTTDGYISTCDEHFLGEGDSSPFIIGKMDWDKKKAAYDKEKIAVLNGRTALGIAGCQSCFLKWSCRAQCPSRTFAETGDIYKPDRKNCKLIKQYAKEYLLYRAREELNDKKKHI